jgi:ribosome-associated protein
MHFIRIHAVCLEPSGHDIRIFEAMSTRRITSALLSPELEFATSRSSGPGGQNVNKVETKVTLKFNVQASSILTDEEKATIQAKLATRITTDGVLVLAAQEKRSQLQNKEAVIAKFDELIAKAFFKPKARRATKPSKAAKEKRFTQKKQQSEKKKWRRGLE